MNRQRAIAEKAYEAALAKWNALAVGNDLAAWEKADTELIEARKNVVAAQMAFPTFQESRRTNNELRLRNRGLDF